MTDTSKIIEPGSWVQIPQLWPGFWRIYRVLTGFYELRWSLDDPKAISKRTIVFCHRLVNNSGKRSFSHQSCEQVLAEPISDAQLANLESKCLSNTALMKPFEKYCSANRSIDLIANLAFGDLSPNEVQEFSLLCERLLSTRIAEGVTFDDALHLVRGTWLQTHKSKSPQMATLQLTCLNHELREGDFVFRKFRTLRF